MPDKMGKGMTSLRYASIKIVVARSPPGKHGHRMRYGFAPPSTTTNRDPIFNKDRKPSTSSEPPTFLVQRKRLRSLPEQTCFLKKGYLWPS